MMLLHVRICNATLLREKSMPRVTWESICYNNVVGIWSLLKVVQHVVATNGALKIVKTEKSVTDKTRVTHEKLDTPDY